MQQLLLTCVRQFWWVCRSTANNNLVSLIARPFFFYSIVFFLFFFFLGGGGGGGGVIICFMKVSIFFLHFRRPEMCLQKTPCCWHALPVKSREILRLMWMGMLIWLCQGTQIYSSGTISGCREEHLRYTLAHRLKCFWDGSIFSNFYISDTKH